MRLITGHIYKPDRELYYIDASEEAVQDFYHGEIPEELKQYAGAFGTYDSPGLFWIRQGEETIRVFGIEYRAGDSRVVYPEKLQKLPLRKGFLLSAMRTSTDSFNGCDVQRALEYVISDVKRHLFDGMIEAEEDPELVQLFHHHGSTRLCVQAKEIRFEDIYHEIVPETDQEKYLAEIAYHDLVTGHYNWTYLWPILSTFAMRGMQDFAFVHFDVKDFNALNVVYGHDIANAVLYRITEHMKKQDWIYYSARCHNDNFAMMIEDMEEDLMREKLETCFAELSPLVEDPKYHVYFRCGVVPMRNCLLLGDRVADAGKEVQRRGTKGYVTEVIFYTDDMHDELEWSTRIKAYLETAIAEDEFLVYLQPKYDIATEKIKGAEALIRWKYQGKTILSPARFVPIFETGGLIGKLDSIVLHKVCQALQEWKREGLPLYPISVNLSRKSFGNPELIHRIVSIVDQYDVDHSLIDFELTESAAYEDQEYMISVIYGLKEHGFRISVDDFGTGYSSLGLLTKMPMDTIKIDKSFVDGIGTVKETYKECAVVRNMIQLAKELRVTCLAEGAEEKSQVEKLREFGCDVVQGYYYSKPLPMEEYVRKISC